MARKNTYEDLKWLQEGQSALAAKVNELQGSLTRIETMLELGFHTSQSQKQIQVQELAEMQDHIQHENADNHEQLRMEVVQTINKEISSVANNTAAVVNNSKSCFSSSLTSPKQSKFSSAPKDSHNSNVSNGTMLFNAVRATRQAHCMQQDILPAQFLSVGNALGYGGQVFSDFKVFAIHLPFNPCSTWIHSFLATPKYLMALALATGTQPLHSLWQASLFACQPGQCSVFQSSWSASRDL